MSFLSSTVCEEFIEILGERVEEVIVDELKAAKYYSVSVDSTPDVSHTDQFAVIFRYDLAAGPVERLIKFIPIYSHNGVQLACYLPECLDEKGISIKDCRGQFSDNAPNMSGKYVDMQSIIREENPLAL